MKKYFIIILLLLTTTLVFTQIDSNKFINTYKDTIMPKDINYLQKCFYSEKGGGIYFITSQSDYKSYFKCNDYLNIDFYKKMIIYYFFSSTGRDFPKSILKIYKDEFGNTIIYFDIYPKIKMHSTGRVVHKLYVINKPNLNKTVFMINNRFGRIFTFKYKPNKSYIKYPNR